VSSLRVQQRAVQMLLVEGPELVHEIVFVFLLEYCSTRTWPSGEVNVWSASGSRVNSLPGLSALAASP
jgi:hypothetical protein